MLRHGAPSTDILAGHIDTHGVCDRGLWGCESSCRVYKQPGSLLKLAALQNSAVMQLAADLCANDGILMVRRVREVLRSLPQPSGVVRPTFDEDSCDDGV